MGAVVTRRGLLGALGSCGALALVDCVASQTVSQTGGRAVNTRDRLHEVLARHVEVPGLVYLVRQRGEVHAAAIGTKATGSADPMRRDTIFRIASMTKPVTATAALILVEEGKLRLDDPVDPLLPELSSRRVLRRIDGPLDDTVPAARALTLRDLLTFRMGFGIVWGPPDATPIQRAANELKLGAFGPPHPQVAPPPDEWMRRFATLPLMHQPGECWMYNTGSEVLGVLIARAARTSLDRFFEDRIFAPLGMKDTGFSVPASKLERLATSYMASNPFSPDEGGSTLYDPVEGGEWSKPPAFPSGGAGLVSTVDDYLAFASMLLSGRTAGGQRILSKASVDLMTSDQLTAEQKAKSDVRPTGYWTNHGWGFGMSITTGPRDAQEPGGYGWDGGLGTSWRSDPAHDLVAILLTQRSAFPPMAGVYRDFWSTVYDSVA
jgi:CubicO group peptidase (beta-lactamase class C family)